MRPNPFLVTRQPPAKVRGNIVRANTENNEIPSDMSDLNFRNNQRFYFCFLIQVSAKTNIFKTKIVNIKLFITFATAFHSYLI